MTARQLTLDRAAIGAATPDVPHWVLTLQCRDQVGIVAAITRVIARIDGFILDSQQYADLDSGQFFMRLVFAPAGLRFPDADDLHFTIERAAELFAMRWQLSRSDARPRVLIAVSNASHCLNDLLHRARAGHLPIEVAGVVSNHAKLAEIADWYQVPYHHLPVEESNRDAQEAALLALFEDSRADLLVLARYMQILSPHLAEALAGRCINIHHSFLPGFKGQRPYHAAHARGVKLIGATAHFVTRDLDEGPIIEQAVERVDHRATPGDLVRIGRDIEAQVLARALGWVAEQRVFLNGLRTIVFR
ncbi:MAG: formyltetrahydrofolate deformylase [Sphingomonas sp.]|uniref:formyltetrahydrofolate deformylase n=1 Tax=Sphingomonas sp. TaxID=28214 RepID=UPI0025D0CBF7|nr:formyltetrahydrofolate deformylase [Sphingomonas sp.]MBX3566352.1 formyltetrahydrofolate deformylase [Sphingomonas sp.]